MKKPTRKANGFEELCAAAAGAEREDQVSQQGAGATHASEIKVLEVDAFSSVHDMIHAAITSRGPHATLRQVYQACEDRGRIAYKRSGGSRLITHNDHWKSQIRHALYTCDRFRRVGEGQDSWMISQSFQHLRPQTMKVLVRTDVENAGSVSDETAIEGRKQPQPPPARPQAQRRAIRRPSQDETEPPLLSASQRRKRTSRSPAGKGPKMGTSARSESPLHPEHIDESSHMDHSSALGFASQHGLRGATPPASSQMDCTVTPSPLPWRGGGEQSPWQRAAQHLNSNLHGSDDEVVLADKRARSAEAESPSSTHQLYALRSRTRPPPGFGENPDPAAERAAREAHAMTTGPLKKRLKAAAKAAEMAMTAASGPTEEASTVTALGIGATRAPTPSLADTSCNNGKPPVGWSLGALSLPRPNPHADITRCRAGQSRGMSLFEQVTARPTHAAHLASLSSQGDADEDSLPSATALPPAAIQRTTSQVCSKQAPARGPTALFQADGDAQEGADETDEGGSKRLLRSQTAAIAADLERDSDLDRTGWH